MPQLNLGRGSALPCKLTTPNKQDCKAVWHLLTAMTASPIGQEADWRGNSPRVGQSCILLGVVYPDKSPSKRETSRKGLFEVSFFVRLAKIIFLSSL